VQASEGQWLPHACGHRGPRQALFRRSTDGTARSGQLSGCFLALTSDPGREESAARMAQEERTFVMPGNLAALPAEFKPRA